MRKSTFVLGGLGVMGALGTAWFGYAWRSESARVAELERELATNATTRTDVPHRPEIVASRSPSEPEMKPAAGPGPRTIAAPEASKRATTDVNLKNWQQREREMLKDPEYRHSQVVEGRRRFAKVRADAIRVVGMTVEQADRMVDLWVERNLRFTELGATNGQPPSDEVQAEIKRAGAAEQAELRQLLGEETYARWQRYLVSGEERAEVSQFRAQLEGSGASLSDAQADALVEAIYTQRQRRSADYEEYVKAAGITDRYTVSREDRQRWLDLETEANARIHTAMTASLSAAQLASLDESLAARLAPVEAALRLQH